jgi:HPt (histidine-containing phosphotransfer) domain-containing protein
MERSSSLDRETLAQLHLLDEGEPGFLGQVFKDYLFVMDGARQTFREAQRALDARRLCTIAHGLKGASATIGAAEMKTLCAALEKAAGANAWPEIERLIDGVEAEAKRLHDDIRGELVKT